MGGDDERGGSVVERWVMAKFTLRFVAAVSFFSFVYSYFSGLWSYNLQFSTLIFSLFAHSLDRKYMFLICNGIVAFLVKNLTFTSSSSSSSGFVKSAEDSVKHVGDILVQENAAECEEEEMEKQQQEMKVQDEDEDEVEESVGEEKEINAEADVEDESEEEEDEVEEENKVREEEVISDACVSTEELNHKFEEFIRKMKEEIRIEAQQQQQQLVAAVPV